MKRLAVVLAAVLPATGCFWGECNRSVTVDWPAFELVGGTTSSCSAAGVSTIDVWVNDAYAATFDCAGPPGQVGLARGSNRVTVEARDVDGVIRLRDELSVDGSSCGNHGAVAARPAEGRVEVSYQFYPTNVCYSDTVPSFLWVYVRDDIANEIAADSSAAPEANNACGVNFPLSFRLAAGDYTLLRTQEMIRGPAGTYQTVGADCAGHRFTVPPAGTVGVGATLTDASASCP